MDQWTRLALGLLFILTTNANPLPGKPAVATEFIILHNNDMHARFEQTNVNSEKCSAEDVKRDKCYGGFARVASEVRKYRAEAKNGGTQVFYLNAGDTYTGTAWFALFKDKIASSFLNKLQPDAICLGNHEFDEKVEGLVPFLNDVNFPVLACNLDLTNEPALASAKHLANSTILVANGTKIAVIGYLTPDTKQLSIKNNVIFNEEVVAINAEAARLRAQGIRIIIALGHSGYTKDQEIAKECAEVDIVIGGHTNTFLYNGDKPSVERVDGPYPTVITQKSGKRVPVVQAYAYTKYLGKLHVKFDGDGNLVEFNGSPILLNAAVTQDQEVLSLLELYRENVTALEQSVVGHSKVLLEGQKAACRSIECNMGNLITDALIFSRVMEDQGGDYWTDASIAFHQGGGIRSSIDIKSDGMITQSDLLTVLPFENDIYITKISGKSIRNALEHAAAVRFKDSDGAFLQVSGLHVVYNSDMPEGSRVVSVEVRCASCTVPSYSPLSETEYYKVIVPQFLFEGGDGHIMIDEANPTWIRMQKTVVEAVTQYLQNHKHKMLWSLILFVILLDESDAFKFTIVHNNDMHARYDPIKGSSGKCPKGHDERGLCFGGLARVATAVAKARAEGPTLYLNAGDTFQGTSWYGVYRGQLAAELLNLLDLDAMALGNHEFDDNVAGLVPFLTKVKFPVVCCNLNVRRVPQLQGLENLVHSTVITKLGRKIGIIGYITPLTKYYVPYNNIEYLDEISSINLEAKLLIMQGVNIIIALGHSGYEKDRMIALHCPDVDVVIGGHSHTFLYTGNPPDEEKPEGDYPTVMTRSNGQQVPVLQAYAFTKYLGKINLEFDDTGKFNTF
ncbi:hypothetical protein ACLKA6_020009 [Drosophila palustris]